MTEDAIADGRFEVRSTSGSHFAWIRTRLSIERTPMAWMRTATALIGFGFTIVQFFQHIQGMEGIAPAQHPEAGSYLGLALIAAGVLPLLVSIWQYHQINRYLWSATFTNIAGIEKGAAFTPLRIVAIGLTIIGLFAFFAVLLRFV